MPGLNKNRKRNTGINIRISPQERAEIEARIKITGLSKTDYFLKTFNKQAIELKVGKFESDRLASEIKKLVSRINVMDSNNTEVLDLLTQIKEILAYIYKNGSQF